MNQVSSQQDMLNAQVSANNKTQEIIGKMRDLAKQAENTNDATTLQKIQIQLQDLQRNLDVMKQIEEALAKATQTINKFVQAQ